MNHDRDRQKPPGRIREPVQVYLDPADQKRLERLRDQLQSSKSDVLRRGLEALEREITDPARHPALQIIGIAQSSAVVAGSPVSAGSAEPEDVAYDVAREHDRFLSDSEVESWDPPQAPGKKGRRGR